MEQTLELPNDKHKSLGAAECIAESRIPQKVFQVLHNAGQAIPLPQVKSLKQLAFKTCLQKCPEVLAQKAPPELYQSQMQKTAREGMLELHRSHFSRYEETLHTCRYPHWQKSFQGNYLFSYNKSTCTIYCIAQAHPVFYESVNGTFVISTLDDEYAAFFSGSGHLFFLHLPTRKIIFANESCDFDNDLCELTTDEKIIIYKNAQPTLTFQSGEDHACNAAFKRWLDARDSCKPNSYVFTQVCAALRNMNWFWDHIYLCMQAKKIRIEAQQDDSYRFDPLEQENSIIQKLIAAKLILKNNWLWKDVFVDLLKSYLRNTYCNLSDWAFYFVDTHSTSSQDSNHFLFGDAYYLAHIEFNALKNGSACHVFHCPWNLNSSEDYLPDPDFGNGDVQRLAISSDGKYGLVLLQSDVYLGCKLQSVNNEKLALLKKTNKLGSVYLINLSTGKTIPIIQNELVASMDFDAHNDFYIILGDNRCIHYVLSV